MSVRYVEAKIRKMKKTFKHLKKATLESLEKYRIPVNRVAETLRSLSADGDDDHKLFTEKHMSVFEEAGSNSVLIGHLDFNMDYLSYHLLDCVIHEFQLEDVKVQMEAYKSDVQKFRVKVPLTVFCRAKSRTGIKFSSEFKEVVAEFPHPSGLSLENMEQFRKKYTTHYNLRDCSMILAGVSSHDSSFVSTWLIPQSVVDALKKTLPRVVFEEHSVSKFSVAGVCVYRCHKISRCVFVFAIMVKKLNKNCLFSDAEEDDYSFVENPSKDFFCPVMMDLLLQPHLTSCCGKHVSQDAVRQLKKEGKGCPLCNKSQWKTMLSIHYLRQVTELRVFCRDSECDWQGELSQLEGHMQSNHGLGCNFTSRSKLTCRFLFNCAI